VKSVTHVKGKLDLQQPGNDPVKSIKIGEVNIISLLDAYNGLEVEIQIRLIDPKETE
jgi:hypothetical protein